VGIVGGRDRVTLGSEGHKDCEANAGKGREGQGDHPPRLVQKARLGSVSPLLGPLPCPSSPPEEQRAQSSDIQKREESHWQRMARVQTEIDLHREQRDDDWSERGEAREQRAAPGGGRGIAH
jgi:hypothetical protein